MTAPTTQLEPGLPELPTNAEIEQRIYNPNCDAIRELMRAYALSAIAAKQTEIDRLMLEYCPNEMTAEQKANWARHQRPAAIAADRNKREGEQLPRADFGVAALKGLSRHVKACPDYKNLIGDMDAVDKAIALLSAAPVSAGLSDEEIRFRFFKNMNSEQRLAVFRAFGVYPDGCNERLNHSIERRLLDAILKRSAARALSARLLPEGWVSVKKDAERYRFLRHADLDALAAANWKDGEVYAGEAFDAAIDAAIAAAPSEVQAKPMQGEKA